MLQKLCVFTLSMLSFSLSAQKPMTMNFVNWMHNDPKLIFVSENGDTSKFIINASALRDKKIERKIIEYKRITKDTSYYADLMGVDTSAQYPPRITLYLEGCISDLNSKKFETEYLFNKKVLNDVAIFEVMHNNYNYFDSKKAVEKVWWSATEGLLKYTTIDKITWTRLQ